MFRVVKKFKQEHTGHDRNGDVFIVQRDKKVHDAGVYSDGQIVQLKRTFFNNTEIGKVNVDGFTGGNRFAIYRKVSGIPRSFKENVEEAMSRRLEKNFSEYNCIEFVLELLEIYLQPTESDCKKISSGAKPKGFNVVKGFSDEYSGNAKLGDLFIVQSGIFVFEAYYAGVCCRENGPEIIQFTCKSRFVCVCIQ
ncbi:uncharacterized protein DAT39_007372 [Clarias magur]|uniref:Uncharacterized protein n=1 Tax=Clarias magur TaxID=1594786 RepID=A0A8J4XCT9_CLAMG|nr:uncharacterized protein DAT39_007372 [Clarias magur]